jgi:methionyl-tRNA formyltransferase
MGTAVMSARAKREYVAAIDERYRQASLYELWRHGAVNRHLGLLPEMRGSDCPIWAFALQRPECSAIRSIASSRRWTGDVLLRRPVAVGGEPSLGVSAPSAA